MSAHTLSFNEYYATFAAKIKKLENYGWKENFYNDKTRCSWRW